MTKHLHKVSLASVVVLAVALAGPAGAQVINSFSAVKNAGNSADNFQDGTVTSFQRTTTIHPTGTAFNQFKVRYAEVVGVDVGFTGSDTTNTQNSDYTITFSTTAPVAYVAYISTSINGAFTLVDDGGGTATANMTGVSGTPSGGTFSGSISLTDPGSLSGNGGGNSPFSRTSTGTITGLSNGSAQTHTLRFTWSASCSTSASFFTNGDECAVRMGHDIDYAGETAGDYPGVGGRTIGNDGHFVTVTVISLCGNGTLDLGEQCDLGASNGLSTTCCTANCQYRASGSTCRGAAGACDNAETCTGSSEACPADAFKPSTTVCRLQAGGCDITENCPGNGPNCPADAKQPLNTPCTSDGNPCTRDICDGVSVACTHPAGNAGTTCRAAAGVCDVAETCTGSSPTCPADQKSTAVCRSAGGACDVAESCDGVGNNCPPDVLVAGGTQCRASAGACDVAETCDGFNVDCPADSVAGALVVCRSAGGECDLAENCDGVGVSCPADAKQSSGTACTSDGNACTLDQCNGSSNACQHPAGNAGASCRAAGGECDLGETCDGSNPSCPADAKQPSGTACTADASPCTLDQCDGSSNACQHPAGNGGTECRAAAGECDPAESCDGSSTSCPGDAKEPSGTPCAADASPCTLDQCDGSSNTCQHPAGNGGTECRASAGECDIAESCTGSNPSCPADGKQPSGTACTADGSLCSLDQCDGSSATCQHPAGNAGTQCRAAAGVCDVAELCDGGNPSCPADAVAPTSQVCRAAAGDCDVAENCDGAGVDCPADAFEPAGTACNDGEACTTDECDGNGVCVGTQDLDACLDDFQCFKLKRSTGTPSFVPVLGVTLADSFETGLFDVKRPKHLCAPADTGEGIVDAVTHLKSYTIKPSIGQPVHVKRFNILVTNDFGSIRVDTRKADFLLVPTAKDLVGPLPPPPPDPLSHNVDHYKCYKVGVTRGTPKFVQRQVTVQDQFTNPAHTYDVKSVKHLCKPVEKNGEAIKEAARHLLCYKVKPAIGQPLHTKVLNVLLNNQFGPERIDTVKEDELCLLSELP